MTVKNEVMGSNLVFQASSFQLLKLENLLRWSFFTFIYNHSSNMNYFIYTSHNELSNYEKIYVTLHVWKLHFNPFRRNTTPRNFFIKIIYTFLVEVCCMETSINLLGISANSYIASVTECLLIVTCDLWPVICDLWPAKETCGLSPSDISQALVLYS